MTLFVAARSFECIFERVTNRPVEWDVLHPLDGSMIAIIRLVWLGPRREARYRAVSPEADRGERTLIGYWETLDAAHEGVLALYERVIGRSLGGGNLPPSRPLVPQAPPPGGAEPGRPARPARHSSRA